MYLIGLMNERCFIIYECNMKGLIDEMQFIIIDHKFIILSIRINVRSRNTPAVS